MSEPFIGQIDINAFTFAPKDWANCDGQTIQISQNPALYSLISTTYGGNATTTFNLPDLRGRAPVGQGSYSGPYGTVPYTMGLFGGPEAVTLSTANLPAHSHTMSAAADPGTLALNINGMQLAQGAAQGPAPYAPSASNQNVALNTASVDSVGGGGAHDNMQPYLVMRFCIATTGIYPSRN